MALRPVFVVKNKKPYYEEILTEFTYYSGFSATQKKRSIESLHNEFQKKNPSYKILEISRFSSELLGQELSAFNLKTKYENTPTVECVFQAGKVFENGGPYIDLLSATSFEAKKDSRLLSSGAIVEFELNGDIFPINPKTFFYDWIYINAIYGNDALTEKLVKYSAFTDIAFNPQKSINCQARSAAIFCSLYKNELIDSALASKDDFKRIVYPIDKDTIQQYTLAGWEE